MENTFRYYFINRPPFIGTHPKENLVKQEAWEPAQPGPTSPRPLNFRNFHGWAEYSQPLSCDQIWKYELYPADLAEDEKYADWRETNNK